MMKRSADSLLLVSAVEPVPEGYRPGLEEAGTVMLEKNAALACRNMLSAAEKDGISIKTLSGYRTPGYQRLLWERSIAGYLAEGLSPEEAERLTGRYLARPGHSEHETGLACDLCTPGADDTEEDFGRTPQGKWLSLHAAGYGFILRYPRMKEHITGIAYEPWHYRYTGLPHSLTITRQGLTLEEYLYYYC